jgi:hypothetical protein
MDWNAQMPRYFFLIFKFSSLCSEHTFLREILGMLSTDVQVKYRSVYLWDEKFLIVLYKQINFDHVFDNLQDITVCTVFGFLTT